ncbi:MAG TPA: DegT/DnrJ/EryC1/StrS family aminotransferase [Polyangia bacterium]|nr:DegT/DnrJ/EryC1/StrS family aminotransferase [Polyangia bacterium]
MADEPIPFHRPSLGDGEREAVIEVLDSGWLTTGVRTDAFEKAFAGYVGTAHAVGLNSATAALHLAMEGLGVGREDEVIVPTYTFAASAETVQYLGARPVLVDVNPQTANVDPAAVAAVVGRRTRAVEVVHIAGLPADIGRVIDVVGDVPVIEDVAHAFPSPIPSLGGRFAGTIGRAGAFSFYATKTITTGEGGMLVTDDASLAERARTMRLHGIGRDAWKRYTAAGSWYYEIEAAGFKDNLTDLAAAIGLVQLKRAAELRAARAEIAARYLEGLASPARNGRLSLPVTGVADEHAWHLFIVRLGGEAKRGDTADLDLPGVSGLPPDLRLLASRRARTINKLREVGVGTSVHFIPLHLHPLYHRMGYRPGQFPGAEAAYAGAISLPIWPGMSDTQIDRVIDAVVGAVDA